MITEYKEYFNPKKVYIPLTDNEYKIANVAVEEGDKVLIGQKLADKFKGKEKRRVISSISGTVVGFEEKCDRFGKIVDHIIIENDNLEEQVEVPVFEEQVTSSQVRNRLADFAVQDIAVDGLFTAIDFATNINHIVVSAVYVNEPFVSTDYEFVEKNGEAIASGVELLATAANAESITVLVDRFMPKAALDELGKAIVDRDINLVTIDAMKNKDWDYKYIRKLVGEDLNPNLLAQGVIFTNVSAAKMVHDAVRLGKAPSVKEVALTGNGLKVNVLYNVKIGTLLPELVEDIEGYNEVETLNVHVGNYLTGTQIPTDDIAITHNVDAIRLSEYREVEEDVCIKCGDCNDACPAGILPQNIMDAELRNVNQRIVDLDTHLCTECGLCTYVCPSKINVLEWVRRAKRRVG